MASHNKRKNEYGLEDIMSTSPDKLGKSGEWVGIMVKEAKEAVLSSLS